MADRQFVCSAIIKETNILDVSFNVPYGEGLSDRLAETYILGRKNLISTTFIEPAHTDGLYGSAYNPHLHHSFGVARIAENNTLDIKLNLIQPPIMTLVANAVQDTYTRQSKPTINYGNSQTLAVGKAGDGEYRSFIDIDLSSIASLIGSGMTVLSINLVINKLSTTDGTIYFHECYTPWYENYLLWINNINYSEAPIFIQEVSGSQVVVDVTSYVESLIADRKFKLSLLLKSDDFILLNARESGIAPRIEVRYIDPNWVGHTDENIMSGSAIIKTYAHKNFYSSYRLREKSDFVGSARKRDTNLVEGSVWKNKPYVIGSATPVVSSYVAGNAYVKARKDLAGGAYKNPSLGLSSAYVPYRKELLGSAVIPHDADNADRIDQAFILKTTWLSEAEIVRSSYFNGSAIVRGHGNTDVTSYVFTQNQPIGSAILRHGKDLIANAIIRDLKGSNLESVAYIDRPYLISSYRLRKSKDMYGSAYLKALGNNDMPSQAEVTNCYIYSSYYLGVSKNIPSSAYIKQWESNSLPSSVIVPPPSDILGEAFIRRSDDIDLPAEAIVQRSDFNDIISSVEVGSYQNIISSADVFNVSDVYASAIISQFDVDDRNAQAFVANGYYRFPIPSLAFVKQINSFLVGKAEIRTWARTWRPNVEGGLIFDRKLPRLWRREDFII